MTLIMTFKLKIAQNNNIYGLFMEIHVYSTLAIILEVKIER